MFNHGEKFTTALILILQAQIYIFCIYSYTDFPIFLPEILLISILAKNSMNLFAILLSDKPQIK